MGVRKSLLHWSKVETLAMCTMTLDSSLGFVNEFTEVQQCCTHALLHFQQLE